MKHLIMTHRKLRGDKMAVMIPESKRDGLKYFNSRLSISTYGGCYEDIEGMRGTDRSRRLPRLYPEGHS